VTHGSTLFGLILLSALTARRLARDLRAHPATSRSRPSPTACGSTAPSGEADPR